jgi:hypothetical protein
VAALWSARRGAAFNPYSRGVPLRRLRYTSVQELLARELVREEDPGTAALIRDLAGVRPRGTFTRAEFLRMCRWKSPRARLLWEKNSPARIRAVSRAVLATRDERRRMELLTDLAGVGVPMASAILTLIDPRRYGVLDIRAWQLLFAIRSVAANRRGQGFTIAQWEIYLAALREHARHLGVSARTIEYTLFHCHRKFQRGTLYVRSERRLRRRNPVRGGGREEHAARRATTVGRGAQPPSESKMAPTPRGGGRARGRP